MKRKLSNFEQKVELPVAVTIAGLEINSTGFAQKATELGVSEIIPLKTRNVLNGLEIRQIRRLNVFKRLPKKRANNRIA